MVENITDKQADIYVKLCDDVSTRMGEIIIEYEARGVSSAALVPPILSVLYSIAKNHEIPLENFTEGLKVIKEAEEETQAAFQKGLKEVIAESESEGQDETKH